MKLTPKEANAIVNALRYVNDQTNGDPRFDPDDDNRHSAIEKLEPLARLAIKVEDDG